MIYDTSANNIRLNTDKALFYRYSSCLSYRSESIDVRYVCVCYVHIYKRHGHFGDPRLGQTLN